MTVHYGFFNSINGDRVYDAEDFSRFYDGLIFDGVYSAVGNRFNVEAISGLYISVDTGRAWFDHTWIFNDQILTLELQIADTVYDRIDAVVIETNKDQRKNFIKVVVGTPDSNPARPTLTNTDSVHQHAIAYILVPANAESIDPANISYVVDTAETPLVSGLNLVGLPSGGAIGTVLAKESGQSGAVGWYPWNQLPTDDWFHPTGVTDSDVIAAYKFKGASSAANAKRIVNNSTSSYDLNTSGSNVTWSAANGFYIPAEGGAGLDNATLRSQNWGTVAVKFSGASTGSLQVGLVHKTLETGIYAHYEMSSRKAENGAWNYYRINHNYPAFSNGVSLKTNQKYTATPGENATSGVISCNLTALSDFYYNGQSCALTACDATNESNMYVGDWTGLKLFGNIKFTQTQSVFMPTNFGSVYIHAAVIYNRNLNATEIAQLHTLMAAL